MNTFSVSLLVHSSSLSVDELSAKLGRSPASGSHSKGEPHVLKDRPTWSETTWRFDTRASKNDSLQDHLEDLKVRFPPSELRTVLPAGCTVRVDIAIFFDSANVSASIPRGGIEIIDAYDADLEVTCYPTLQFEKETNKF